ncbi:hypothetical protein AMTRI_Chr08g203110 [Amborella trichopoda]|uniref:Folylpolyglutamate synthase n=1 Tax=Amborella trichopoda TaxID=13333 RepID=W1PJ91_AMBTC|nr:hypothetical protein AMTR_s00012p00264440 [Amborella trichopoda]
MSAGDHGATQPNSQYEEALSTISSLITRRVRADGKNMGDQFDLMFQYIKMLDLEEPISQLKIIHVAGTKGKGSTCTFVESILRTSGFHTGLFTSPHLIDIRERFRVDGMEISEEKFLAYFWWCWNRLKEKTDEDVPMPTYFRFLALLAFKIFTAEQVDVAILEVGLGGKFDATNVVQSPVVCGISSLGFDHVEILGNTLGQIAGEKAGIFKHGVPAFTVRQPDEAMCVLEKNASELGISLQIALPLDVDMLGGLHLGLSGDHQYINAGLAIALCRSWLERTGQIEGFHVDQSSSLPKQFVEGLARAHMQGRAQIVPDQHLITKKDSDMRETNSKPGELIFFLDGAHSPESIEVCARWFCRVIKEGVQFHGKVEDEKFNGKHITVRGFSESAKYEWKVPDFSGETSAQFLLFNCMSVRDPQLLLPPLINTCALSGVHFHKALFVPNQSAFNKVSSHALPSNDPPDVDLSWQLTLQRAWDSLIREAKGTNGGKNKDSNWKMEDNKDCHLSDVFPSLPQAIKWLRDSARQNPSVRFQVLVTGSLHLVGDVLRLIKK